MQRTRQKKGWLERSLGLKPQDRAPAMVLMVTGALLIAGYTVAKSVRDSLFLAAYPAERLPLLLISLALLTAPVVSAYTRISGRLGFHILAPGFYGLVALGFLCLERLTLVVSGWPAVLLYFYVSLLGLLAVTQFWLIVGWRFNTREARRLMGVIGTGSIVGGMVGGILAQELGRIFPPERLLWFVAAIFGCAGLASWWVTHRHQRSNRDALSPTSGRGNMASPEPARGTGVVAGLKKATDHPLLRGIALLIGISVMLGTLTDYQLKAMAKATYPDKGDLVSFFGTYYAVAGVLTLVVQLGVTQFLLRRWSIVGGLFAMPTGLLAGCLAMLAHPGIATAAMLRGAEQVIRNSAWRSAYEILFLPLPAELRKQTKPVLDVFLERSADGLAGLSILILAGALGVTPWGLTWVTLILVVLLALVIARLRDTYIQTLETNLSVAVNTPVSHSPVLDGMTLHTLEIQSVPAGDPSLLRSLEISLHSARMSDMPMDLLRHSSPEVRGRALDMLDAFGKGRPPSLAQIRDLRALATEAADKKKLTPRNQPETGQKPVRERLGTMVDSLCHGTSSELAAVARQLSGNPDIRLASAVLHAFDGNRNKRQLLAPVLHAYGTQIAGLLGDHLLHPKTSLHLKRQAARLLGKLDSRLAELALAEALTANDTEVRRAASAALYQMRIRGFAKPIGHQKLARLLKPELRRTRSVWAADTALQRSVDPKSSTGPLAMSVKKNKARSLRHLFRLLGLSFPPEAIQASYRALTAGNASVRDQALEYLDNVLPESIRQLVWPFIDPEQRWTEKPKNEKPEEIARHLLRAGVTIELSPDMIDLGLELSGNDDPPRGSES